MSRIYIALAEIEPGSFKGSAEANFLKGHLAVLLGLLSKDSSSFENIMDLLPGDSRSSKLQSWIDAVTEFTSFYSELTARFAEAIQASHSDMPEEEEDLNDEGNLSSFISSKSNHATYSTNTLLRIQESQGEKKGIELARNILQILEGFRVSSSTS